MKHSITTLLLAAHLAAAHWLFQVRIPGPGGLNIVRPGNGSSGPCTPASGYSHCRQLTIDHTQAGGSTLANFAVLVRATLGSSRIQSSNCYDVVFTSDSGGSSKIPWEIESCSQSSGAIIAWVGLSTLSASSDTSLYVSYDNPSATTAQNIGSYAPIAVWDSSFVGVWHLPNGSTLTTADSTGNGNNGSNSGTVSAATGLIDGAGQFSGSNYISAANSSSLNFSGALTMECWVYPTASSAPGALIVKGGDGARDYAYFLFTNTNSIYYDNVGALTLSTPWALNAWNYLVLTDSGTALTVYLNGQPVYSGSNGVGATNHYGANVSLGYASYDSSYGLVGRLDEVRLSRTVRSAGYVAANQNNQIAGSTFVTVGSEQ